MEWRWRGFGFVVGAAYWPGLLTAAYDPRWAAVAVGLPLVSPLALSRVAEPIRWTLVFLLALGGVSLLGSPDAYAGAQDLIYMAILCVALVAGAGLERIDDFMAGLAAALGASAVFCIGQWFDVPWAVAVSIPGQAGGLFFSAEVMAELAALVLLWALFNRVWWAVLTAGIPVALNYHSRVALLTLAVGVAVYFIQRWRWRWGLLYAALATSALAVFLLVAFTQGKFDSAMHRLVLWGAVGIAWWEQPWGNGLGWFVSAHPYEQLAHSDALQALAELGPGAMVALLIPYFAFKNGGNRAERAIFAAVCIQVAISFPLHFPASGVLAALLAGRLLSVRALVRDLEPDWGLPDDVGFFRGHEARPATAGHRRSGSFVVAIRSVLAAPSCLHQTAVGAGAAAAFAHRTVQEGAR